MLSAVGPEALTALAAELEGAAAPANAERLRTLAAAWQAERECLASLSSQLAESEKRLETLEKDRQWWQDNAIKRYKRSAARKAGSGNQGRS